MVVVGAGGVVVVVVAFALGSLFALAAGTDASAASTTTITAVIARVRTPRIPHGRLIDQISLARSPGSIARHNRPAQFTVRVRPSQ